MDSPSRSAPAAPEDRSRLRSAVRRASGGGTVSARPAAPGRGLGLAALLLLLWVVGLFYLATYHWLIFLAREPPLADLTGRAAPPARLEAGVVRIPGAAGAPVVVGFPPLGLAPGGQYLLSLRAEPGASFWLELLETRSGAGVVRYRVRFRWRAVRRNLVLDARLLPPRVRPRVRVEGPGEIAIRELRFFELPASHRWVRPGFRALGPLLLLALAVLRRRSLARFLRAPPAVAEAPGAPAAAAGIESWDRFVAWSLFLVLVVAFHAAPVLQIMDAKYLSAVSQSLLESGRLSLPPEFGPATLEPVPYHLERVDGRIFHSFSSAPAVLNVPFVAAFKLFGIAPLGPDGQFLRRHEETIFKLAAAVVAAALCAVLYLLARLFQPPLPSLGLTLLFAFGTQIFSTVSRAYWSHGWAVLLLALALYLLLSPRLVARGWAPVAAATCLSWSFFCRPSMSLSVLGISAWLLATHRDRFLRLAATGAAWAVALVIWSLVVLGRVLPSYLLSGHVSTGELGFNGLALYGEAVLGTLVSPGRGLFVYVPIFAVILIGAALRWRRLERRALAVVALVVCALHWQLVSLFRNWSGGQCFGPRLFSDLIPWFFLLALLVAASPRAAPRRPWRRVASSAAIGLAIAASLFINIRGATSRATFFWRTHYLPPPRIARIFPHPGLWNWRYPQFMAGLVERSPEEEPAEP